MKDRGESVVVRARMRTMIRVRVERRGEERRAGDERAEWGGGGEGVGISVYTYMNIYKQAQGREERRSRGMERTSSPRGGPGKDGRRRGGGR